MLILYIVLGIILLIAVLAAIAPKTYNVSRSIEISKPKAEVFNYLKFLKNQDEWSPWGKRDANMEKKFTGIDGEVGAISYWNGNKEVGEGEQELIKIVEGERIDSVLRFLKPWKSTSDAYMITEEINDKNTRVIWGFSGNNQFPMSIMMLFMNMDKMIGKDFEEGLASLKEIMEK
ncbi:SRPBCC family protein [Flagellimonas zhangzhouensis]|uniref:Polyketide cyclase / dehydrase and lipid transport n=1 Tax=Flagellimonas zhangzhouensis TaxID=1073328 RepID=A0A1H2RXI3_9FLAO|nr:SRPBCC family protein [Allomuricauda zhangzhouensis]SDQ68032.1 Polyketide cyclase / dehydrase and lipid transport [Allomuricauda zhangzhouensis]SDW23319.1 Polyketide cyclase / dehydrase and lipid transport [Allomuricauda zhangzhouensis]